MDDFYVSQADLDRKMGCTYQHYAPIYLSVIHGNDRVDKCNLFFFYISDWLNGMSVVAAPFV